MTRFRSFRILRVAAVSALALILWAGPTAAQAQYGGSCYTYATFAQDCPSCCGMSGSVDNTISAPSGSGYDAMGTMPLVCGSNPASCNGSACGTSDVYVPVSNPICYCITAGHGHCVTFSDCCDDLLCSDSGICYQECVHEGGTCLEDEDCCGDLVCLGDFTCGSVY